MFICCYSGGLTPQKKGLLETVSTALDFLASVALNYAPSLKLRLQNPEM